MKFTYLQPSLGKRGGYTSSHILGGITRNENLPNGKITPLGANGGDASKDKRFGAASAPGKQLFSSTIPFGNIGLTGKP